jgi:hypothetical protein
MVFSGARGGLHVAMHATCFIAPFPIPDAFHHREASSPDNRDVTATVPIGILGGNQGTECGKYDILQSVWDSSHRFAFTHSTFRPVVFPGSVVQIARIKIVPSRISSA